MKQIRICAAVLGLLMCTVIARAQQYNITTTVVNAPGAEVLVMGVLKPVVPYTADNNGTVQMTLDFANNPNKTVEITVDQCGDNPPIVYVVYPGTEPPPEKPNCRRRKLPALYIPGAGTLLIDPGKGTATFTPSAPPAGAGPGEGPAPVTFAASFLGGVTTAGNLDTTSGLEGDVAIFFGPGIGVAGGFVRSGDSTGHTAVSGSTPGSSTQVPFTANFHAGEIKGIVKVLGVGPFSIAVQGGAWPFTARETTTTTIIVTTPTGGTTTEVVTRTRSQGGVAPMFGGDLQVALTRYLGAVVAYKHGYLRSGNSLNQSVHMILAGLEIYPLRPGTLLHFHPK